MSNSITKKPAQKFTVIMLAIVFSLPFIGAWVIYTYTNLGSDGVNNSHGSLLIPPGHVPDLRPVAPLDSSSSYQLHGKWNLVYLSSGECASECEGTLELMRGVRAVLGNESYRLQLTLVIDKSRLDEALKSLLTEKRILTLDTIEISGLDDRVDLPGGADILKNTLFLVDPLGNLMMRYTTESTLAGVIKDIKRLLRNSRIG